MKIYFVRHGESEYNAVKRIAGHTDIPLTEKGRMQAEEAAKTLPANISKIYSSDLIRCKQTTEILNKKLLVPVVYDTRLRERNLGSLEGKSWSDFDADDSLRTIDKQLAYDYRQFGGESSEDVQTRITACVDDIRTAENGKTILVVTSSGVIRLLHYVYNNKIPELVHNSSVHEFEFPDN